MLWSVFRAMLQKLLFGGWEHGSRYVSEGMFRGCFSAPLGPGGGELAVQYFTGTSPHVFSGQQGKKA